MITGLPAVWTAVPQSGGCGCLVMLIGLVIAGFASIRTRKTRKR